MMKLKEMKRFIGFCIIIVMAITTVLGHSLTVAATPVTDQVELPSGEEGEELYEGDEFLEDDEIDELPPPPDSDAAGEIPATDEHSSNYPIIIIPGIMGSNLYSSSTDFTRRNRVFAPDPSNNILDVTMVLRLGNNMRMRNTLFPRPMENMNAPGAHQEFGSFQWYRFLAEYLMEAFPEREIFFFAYDFRQDNRNTASRLNEGIEQILSNSDYDKVEIVAHSMGGLIIASYISQYTYDSLGRVVTKGSPYEGAPETFVAVLEGSVTGSFIQDTAVAILGGMGVDVMSEFPSVAQLVPTRPYFEENPFYQFSHTTGLIIRRRHYTPLSYEQYFNMFDTLFRWGSRRNFQEAGEFHQSILSGGINVLADYEYAYFVIGINQRTISGVKFDENSRIRNRLRVSDLIYENYGDGAVPYASQTMMGLLDKIEKADERVRRFDLNHLELVSNVTGGGASDAIVWTVDVLNGNARNTEIYDAQLESRNYTVLRIEGFVEVTVESPEGILSSVEDELSLVAPFGRMDIIGDEGEIIMLALENWEEHEIIINVVDDGTLDYTIRWFDDDNHLMEERNFEDIPVSEDEIITSNTAWEPVTALEIDRSGDGNVDEIWEATENSDGRNLGEPRVLDDVTISEGLMNSMVQWIQTTMSRPFSMKNIGWR